MDRQRPYKISFFGIVLLSVILLLLKTQFFEKPLGLGMTICFLSFGICAILLAVMWKILFGSR